MQQVKYHLEFALISLQKIASESSIVAQDLEISDKVHTITHIVKTALSLCRFEMTLDNELEEKAKPKLTNSTDMLARLHDYVLRGDARMITSNEANDSLQPTLPKNEESSFNEPCSRRMKAERARLKGSSVLGRLKSSQQKDQLQSLH